MRYFSKWLKICLVFVIVFSVLLFSVPSIGYSQVKFPLVIHGSRVYIRVLDDGKAIATVDGSTFEGGYVSTRYGTLYFFQNNSFENPQWLEILVGSYGTAYRWQVYKFDGETYILKAFYHRREHLLVEAEKSVFNTGATQLSWSSETSQSSSDDGYYMPVNKEAVLSSSDRLDEIGPIKVGTELAPETNVLIQYDIHGTGDYYQTIHVENGVRVQPIQKVYQRDFRALSVGSGLIVRQDKVKEALYSLENFPYSLVKNIEISHTYVKSISMTWKIKDINIGSYIDNAFLFDEDILGDKDLFNPPMAGFTTAKSAVSFIVSTAADVVYGPLAGFVAALTLQLLYPSYIYTSYWNVDRTHAQLTTGGLFSMPMNLASPSYYDMYSWSLPNFKPDDLPMVPIYASVVWTVPNYTPQALLYIEGNVLVRVYADVYWKDGSTTSMMLDVPIPVKQIFNVVVPID